MFLLQGLIVEGGGGGGTVVGDADGCTGRDMHIPHAVPSAGCFFVIGYAASPWSFAGGTGWGEMPK